jgi:hypothetical protein
MPEAAIRPGDEELGFIPLLLLLAEVPGVARDKK